MNRSSLTANDSRPSWSRAAPESWPSQMPSTFTVWALLSRRRVSAYDFGFGLTVISSMNHGLCRLARLNVMVAIISLTMRPVTVWS